MIDSSAAFLVRGLNLFFHMMPMGFNLWLGRRLGILAYLLNGKRAMITYTNLKAAFAREKSPREIARITREVYRSVGETFAEMLSMTKIDRKYVDKYIHIENFERVVAAAKNPGGVILLSAHFGDWELSTATSAMKGFPVHLLARDQKMAKLNELLNLLRESKGNSVIRKGLDIKNIFRLLHQGKILGILGDQNAGPSGKLLNLFGRPASTATGPYRFAQKSGALILPAFIHRRNGAHQDLILEEPMVIGKTDDIVPYMEKYNKLLEKHIRIQPGQWFWMHKKWKLTPSKTIMVLSDGKKGHFKQSLAIVKCIEKFRLDEGFREEDLTVRVVDIRYRNRYSKIFLKLAAPFGTRAFFCHGRFLKLALTPETYERAITCYADIIVSCGSALSVVSGLLKRENMARNVAVLDPGPVSRKRFDLVVIPAHDVIAAGNTAHRDNVVVTDLAPNLINREDLSGAGVGSTARDAAGGELGVGLLIGGDNKYFTLSERSAEAIASGIKDACERTGAGLYATTSRRTPQRAETVFNVAFRDAVFSRMFVSGTADKDEDTVGKILAASDIVVVSGESISMVSEAASSGKRVLVFLPDKKTGRITKYERFLDVLSRKGAIGIIDVKNLASEIEKARRNEDPAPVLSDNRRIYEKLYKLF